MGPARTKKCSDAERLLGGGWGGEDTHGQLFLFSLESVKRRGGAEQRAQADDEEEETDWKRHLAAGEALEEEASNRQCDFECEDGGWKCSVPGQGQEGG